ncbi:MAG: type VI secretion system ATPase TssH, partial [Lachnospiraceae bacterium]|nr:type VI secretion system ATPase TssH [Lachnospiraceae bacterium]
MNINKFTQKSIEAVNGCQKVALEYGNQQIEQAHILYSLLSLDDSLIGKLLQKMGIDPESFRRDLTDVISRYPKVSGSSANLYFSNDANRVLTEAEDHAKAMGDEYVSVEHLFLVMIDRADRDMKALFARHNITKDGFLKVLSEVRGNQKVVSDNPEATYDTLNKYGYDLVERARQQKLDPVIGR